MGENRIEEGKGRLKEAAGALFGSNAMKREGKAQQRKGAAQERAAEPDVHVREERAVIAAAGYGERFGHGLGHGLGLLVHEAPVVRPESSDVLAAGNVVTVEPGIYLSGVAGVRIEDLVIVTENGCEVLTSFSKELLTVR
jgi:Xaa-Pro aminopeptidase